MAMMSTKLYVSVCLCVCVLGGCVLLRVDRGRPVASADMGLCVRTAKHRHGVVSSTHHHSLLYTTESVVHAVESHC